jgi:16S rRNA (guanine527-N7)-methyltransferase
MKGYKRPLGHSSYPLTGKASSGARPQPRQGPKPVVPRLVSWSEAEWLAALPPVLATLGLTLDDAQQQCCAAYMGMLAHWNSTYNLTSVRDAPEMFTHHLSDCLAVLPPLARHLAERVPTTVVPPLDKTNAAEASAQAATPRARLLDVGSGGGLPGVLLAIARPDVQVTCVDTVGKKAAFIRQVAAELRLPNLRAEHARVEDLRSQHDIVTSRAFASLADFVALTRERLAPGGVWMAMKARTVDEEQAGLPADVDVFHVEPLQVPGLEAERCLVWMRPR